MPENEGLVSHPRQPRLSTPEALWPLAVGKALVECSGFRPGGQALWPN